MLQPVLAIAAVLLVTVAGWVDLRGLATAAERTAAPFLTLAVVIAGGAMADALFRQLELQFEEALASLKAGLRDEWAEKLCSAGDEIGRLLPPHIEKEEGVLFPMAESMLGEGEWVEVRRLWKDALEAASEA